MNLKSYVKGIGVGMIVASLILIISGNLNKGISDEDVIKRAKELGMVENSSVIQNSDATEVAIGSSADSDGAASKENVSEEKKTDNDTNLKDSDSSDSYASDKEDINSIIVSDSNKEDDTSTASDDSQKGNSSVASDDSRKETNSSNVSDDSKKGNDSADVKDDSDKDSDSVNVADASNDKSDTNASATGETVKVEVKSGMSSESVASAVMKAGLVDSDTEFNKYLCENGYDKRLRVGSFEIPKGSDFETISKHLCGIK